MFVTSLSVLLQINMQHCQEGGTFQGFNLNKSPIDVLKMQRFLLQLCEALPLSSNLMTDLRKRSNMDTEKPVSSRPRSREVTSEGRTQQPTAAFAGRTRLATDLSLRPLQGVSSTPERARWRRLLHQNSNISVLICWGTMRVRCLVGSLRCLDRKVWEGEEKKEGSGWEKRT